eukprot:2180216-Prymnesium_polylepis.1
MVLLPSKYGIGLWTRSSRDPQQVLEIYGRIGLEQSSESLSNYWNVNMKKGSESQTAMTGHMWPKVAVFECLRASTWPSVAD